MNTDKQQLIERIRTIVKQADCWIANAELPPLLQENTDRCFDAIAQEWLEDVGKGKGVENGCLTCGHLRHTHDDDLFCMCHGCKCGGYKVVLTNPTKDNDGEAR